MRRLLALVGALTLATGFALLPALAVRADVPANVGNYGSGAYATGVHLTLYTDAYPNFSTGALDNHYPLAKVRQDGSPLADATATFSDVGPFVNTVTACSNPDPTQCQNKAAVPYANAHFPGGKSADHVDSCSPSAASSGQSNACPTGQAVSYADVKATELSADATGTYAGGGAQPFTGATGDSHTVVNADGSLTTLAHSVVQTATFAGGAIQISKVEVTSRATSAAGSAMGDAKVTIGQVLINGQPTSINDQGVTIQQNQVIPCTAPANPPPQLPPPLGASQPSQPANCVPQVETESFKVYAVAPKKTISGNHATVSATGLHILITQPAAQGAPNQHTEYVIGEAFAEARLDPGNRSEETASTDTGSTEMTGSDLGATDLGSDMGAADNGAGAAPATAAPTKAAAVFVAANRRPLALLFLFWECAVMAAAAAWVWAKRAAAREALAAAAAEEP